MATMLPLEECTEVVGSERLDRALLYRFNHHVPVSEMTRGSYRVKRSRPNGTSSPHEEDPADVCAPGDPASRGCI